MHYASPRWARLATSRTLRTPANEPCRRRTDTYAPLSTESLNTVARWAASDLPDPTVRPRGPGPAAAAASPAPPRQPLSTRALAPCVRALCGVWCALCAAPPHGPHGARGPWTRQRSGHRGQATDEPEPRAGPESPPTQNAPPARPARGPAWIPPRRHSHSCSCTCPFAPSTDPFSNTKRARRRWATLGPVGLRQAQARPRTTAPHARPLHPLREEQGGHVQREAIFLQNYSDK